MTRKIVQLKNRRGAFAIMAAVGFFAMMAVGAIAMDFSRMWTLRNELQTAADAGALAGAIELEPTRFTNNSAVITKVTTYAQINKAMSRTPVLDSLILGNWNKANRTFTPAGAPQNAVRVVTAYNMSGLIMTAFGIAAPRMRARATGWADAPVTLASCSKPWAVPYEALRWVINPSVGLTQSAADLVSPWNQTRDVNALNALTQAQRTFTLKMGAGNSSGAPSGGYNAANMPGNYQPVQLPVYQDAQGNLYPYGKPLTGGQNYRANIEGSNPCATVGLGDVLAAETGGKVGPSIQAMTSGPDYICDSIDANDNCIKNGAIGSNPVVAPFFTAVNANCGGSTCLYTVQLIGSFVVTQVGKGAEITGYFQTIQTSGPVGGGGSTLQKPILAQ